MKTSFEKFMASSAVQPVKVEMALVDDLDKIYQDAIDTQTKAEMMIVDYNDLSAKITSLLNQAGQKYLQANARFADVENAAKELGVDLSAPLQNKKKIISQSIKEIDAYIKKLVSNKVSV